ncbi:pilin [Dyella terrae]|uniref:pilin n=1 Tax=Dyella terrae TaxID=522259 RepID=UPI001EFEDF46|nr:pilin [Dyella terrae]ULU25056.1 pilin [Dyella terrae]
MKNVQKGFTLIELMIVVAIIAILAAIAIPQYQNYITKSQFSESQTIADGLKTPIVEYYNQTGICPTNSTTGFVTAASYSGKYVQQASLSGSGSGATQACIVTVTFKSTAGSVSSPLIGETVAITGQVGNGGAVTWACASTTILGKYMPQVCQGK